MKVGLDDPQNIPPGPHCQQSGFDLAEQGEETQGLVNYHLEIDFLKFLKRRRRLELL